METAPESIRQDTSQELPIWPWVGLNRDCPLDPPPLLTKLRAEQPITRITTIMGCDAWLVTRHADVSFVLSDHRFSVDRHAEGFPNVGPIRPAVPGVFVLNDPPDHTRLRRAVTRNFTSKAVEALRPRIQGHIDELIDDILSRTPPVDLKESIALPLPVRVTCELLGIPHDGAEKFFVNATRGYMRTTTGTTELMRHHVSEAFDYVNRLVADKKREPDDGLLSGLLREMEPDGPINRQEIVGIVMMIMFGSYETTSNMIALAVTSLLTHPDQLARLRADPSLIKSAVEEVLRYNNVLPTGLPRLATEDVVVGGQLVRAGEGVIAAVGSANRDDAAFTDPDRFDIHRFAGKREAQQLIFGYGVHQCLAQMLARVQLQMVLNSLFERIPTIRLAQELEHLPFRHDMFIYGLHQLPVTW